ncbi:MAG: substrate-binding domain-containing protein, partial [Erysipelotrichaceae bacterium]|nr:substrate-binding domain-containing protein [Erysipelotrichaceae bacterium]
MKIKSLVAAGLTLAMLAGCSSSTPAADDGGKDEGAAAEAKTYKVGVAIYQFDDNFMTLYRNEISNYFATKNTDEVKYEVSIVDGKNDMAEQSNQVDNFITQGMDVIILNLVQTSSADAIIDKVVAAGIPLV